MPSKLTIAVLTNSKALEIKMKNILSFYEDLATSIALQSNANYFDSIVLLQNPIKNQALSNITNTALDNVVGFIKPIKRSCDIVDYLIERELRQSIKLTITA